MSDPAAIRSSAAPAAPAAAVRSFGRFQLRRLLGKSERTMAWRVADPRNGQDLVLVLPRAQPTESAALERWQQAVGRGGRLSHPHLAPVVDSGVQDGWPYAAYDPQEASTLTERLASNGLSAPDAAALGVQALQGLAFAHEGGVAHHDVQPYLMLVSAQGQLSIAGLEVASGDGEASERGALRAQRDAAQRDVLALGLLLHHALAGRPAFDEADIGRAVLRLPPLGREIVRLPWGERLIPEALRAIVNRATDRQERQRYRTARTLARALEGWLQTEAAVGQGPLALLLDRLHRVGLLPASPEGRQTASQLAKMERQGMAQLAEVVLQDVALSFELLRVVNTAQVRGVQVSGNGPILTVRRAIAMIGLDGMRRAAQSLRPWPGALSETAAAALAAVLAQSRRAGRIALSVRPAGYDAEVVYLVTQLQSLGRLIVHYHFPEDAQQILRLMQPAASPRAGEPDDPGMSEEGASFAVLGADTESIGVAVARHWGLDDAVLHMIRRQPLTLPLRTAESDDEILRSVASCAHETVDALALSASHVTAGLQRVVQRYGRLLDLDLRKLQEATQNDAPTIGVPDTVSGRL